jgi:hypothetical protein
VVWHQNYWDDFSEFSLKTGGDGFSRFVLKTGGGAFPGLGLKTGSYRLVIWDSKSPRWFLGLGLKTKQAVFYQLRHKTNGRINTVWGTRQDLAACFTWKQVGLGFSYLAPTQVEAWHGWCTWQHREGCVGIKLKMDGSM